MQKLLLTAVATVGLLASQNTFADTSANGINFAGTYACTGYDVHDKAFSDTLIITLNAQNSRFNEGYGAYNYQSVLPNGTVVYTGSMASSGNTFAMTFDNTSTADPTDYGTITGVATYDLDKQGNPHTVLHTFYYEPAYEGGSNGTGTCVKA